MARPRKQTSSLRPGPGAILMVAFLVVPLIEIALFIQIGGLIGLWPTLALIVLTAVAGAGLVRAQGLGVLDRARAALAREQAPVFELFEGLCLLVAGALLLTPGFFTDTCGALLLVPGMRRRLYRRLAPLFERRTGRPDGAAGDVIDVEFEEIGPPDPDHEPRRGWGPRR
jgi:UPF0716 protein FxsA